MQQAFLASTGHVLGCPLGNLALEMSTQDEVLRQRIDTLFRGPERRIEATLEEAKRDGSAPHVDPASASRAVFAYMEGLLLMAKTRNDPALVRELGRSAVALVTGGEATSSAA